MPATIDPRRTAVSLRTPNLRTVVWISAIGVVVLLFVGVAERIAWRGRVMPGVKIVSLDASGQRELAAYASVSHLAQKLETEPIYATTAGKRLIAVPSDVGFRVDTRTTLRHAREAGRSGNPINQVLGMFLRRLRPDRVEPVVMFDDHGVDTVVDQWSAEVDRGVHEGGLRFVGTRVVEVSSSGGTGIDPIETRARLVAALRDGDRSTIRLSYGPIPAPTTNAQVATVAREARAILTHGVRITSSGHTFTATPAQIAMSLTTHVAAGRLTLSIDQARLGVALRRQLDPVGVAPVDAHFEVDARNLVHVVPSHDGLQPDLAIVARAILADRTTVDAPLARRHPARDTAWANRLGITEQVSSFTTHYVPGQSRVTNIHLAADIMNNTVVEPGAVFSLNDTLGPRTPQRGFVKAPVYYDGEAEDYGGGVSQIATTTYNAEFWGGFENVFHQPHTLYYSRYPLGREATVNYPVLDLKWRNNSHHGVLVRAGYTSSSVTITFYGNSEGKVVKEESTNCSSTSPTQRCVDILQTTPFPTNAMRCPPKDPKVDPNNSCALLKPNERLDLAEGHIGYEVTFFRVIDQPGRPEIRERHSWRYDMLPDIILVGAVPKGATTTVAKGHSGTSTPVSTSMTTIP
jgi:vancomycin resistance protein YoaR